MTTLRRHGALAIALLALVVAGGAGWLRLGDLIDAQRPVGHAHRVLGEIGRLGLVANAVDGARGAHEAGRDPAAYRLYRDTAVVLDRALVSVRALTGDDPVHQRILDEIDQVAAQARSDGAATERDAAAGRMTALIGAMHDHEARVLDRLLRDGTASARTARRLVTGILGAAALLVAIAWWSTRQTTTVVRDAEAAAAGRADAERHLAPADQDRADQDEEVRGALTGTG
jgi:hypothetical protein